MKWYGVEPDFEYNTPLDFCGEWVHALVTLCNKSERQAFIKKFKTLSVNFTTTQMIIGIIATILLDLFTVIFSLVVMAIYYITFPIRFFADVACAIYTKFTDKFWG
jgi:cobalamin biosynthesis protein CobD/CbiB